MGALLGAQAEPREGARGLRRVDVVLEAKGEH